MLRDIEMLTRTLGRLPGVGRRSAQRIALALLKDRQGLMQSLSAVLADTAERIKTCGECGNLIRRSHVIFVAKQTAINVSFVWLKISTIFGH